MAKRQESRLSLEGLKGFKVDSGKVVKAIYAHGEERRERTVYFTDNSKEVWSIFDLVGALIEARNGRRQ
jgi:hypothetical protein